MTGLVVFLVLLFSLIFAGRRDDDTNALDRSKEEDSEEPYTDCCQEEDSCHKVKDCCRKIQERCQGKMCWKNHWKQLCAAATRTTETSSIPSGSTPGSTSSTSTDSTLSSHQTSTWTASSPTSSSQSSTSTEPVPSSTKSATDDNPLMVPVLICLAVLFVVVVVVAVFFLWRRKRQADDVRKENNQSCLSAAINFERSQDSQENRRTNIGNASITADNDNNDDHTYINGPAINRGVVRLHEDRPVTDGQHALTDPSVSVARDDSSRCPLEDDEYSSLDPNRQESDYTALNHTA